MRTWLAGSAVDAIVNCTGLGANELAEDSVYPLRGALIRVRNDGKAMPRVTQAHCISHDGPATERGFLFIVPRGKDMLLLGGMAEPDETDLEIGLENYEPIREMYRRCLDFLPSLRDAEIDAAEPVRVGLRPVRRQSVRLEAEPGTRIVHNYGHGGSGVTFSWGCGLEIAERVEALGVVRNHRPRAGVTHRRGDASGRWFPGPFDSSGATGCASSRVFGSRWRTR